MIWNRPSALRSSAVRCQLSRRRARRSPPNAPKTGRLLPKTVTFLHFSAIDSLCPGPSAHFFTFRPSLQRLPTAPGPRYTSPFRTRTFASAVIRMRRRKYPPSLACIFITGSTPPSLRNSRFHLRCASGSLHSHESPPAARAHWLEGTFSPGTMRYTACERERPSAELCGARALLRRRSHHESLVP